MKQKNATYISASEIADYIYCECCWWDKRVGLHEETFAMKQGILEHNELNRLLLSLFSLKKSALLLLGLGILLLIVIFLLINLDII